MPSPKTRTFDVRLRASTGGMALLVRAETHEAARLQAKQDAIAAGHADVEVEWCVEYPPSIKPRHARAITDD